jgi:hypothetical protein
VARTGDACRGGDDGAQWRRDGSGRRVTGWLGQAQGDRDTRRQTFLASALMARRRGKRWPTVIASIEDQWRGERADRRAPPVRERVDREGEGGRADEGGQPISGRGGAARAWAGAREMGCVGRAGNAARGREGEGWAGFSPTEGGFPFSISISISISFLFLLISFFF